jgi:hypothetical protein
MRDVPDQDRSRDLSRLLRTLAESATRREPLRDDEKDAIQELAAELKAMGLSPVGLITRMVRAEQTLRESLDISSTDDIVPPVETLAKLLAGQLSRCPWPGSDFVHAPTVLFQLAFLRQQNAPWIYPGNSFRVLVPDDVHRELFDPRIGTELWNLRLIAGSVPATENMWAGYQRLVKFTDALRFNVSRPGRHSVTELDVTIGRRLFAANRAFHQLLRVAHAAIPRQTKEQVALEDGLTKKSFPPLFIKRLAHELFEHRRNRRIGRVNVTLEDRAALMLADLEGKRGRFGLPEPLVGLEGYDDEDVSQPVIVSVPRPEPGPFRTKEAELEYEKATRVALRGARSRLRRLKAIWNSVPPGTDPNKK